MKRISTVFLSSTLLLKQLLSCHKHLAVTALQCTRVRLSVSQQQLLFRHQDPQTSAAAPLGTKMAAAQPQSTEMPQPSVPFSPENETEERGVPETSDPSKIATFSQMSKRAQKKMLRREKLKEQKRQKVAPYTRNTSPGFNSDIFSEAEYYFENGLRKVYPYHFTFATHVKERWFGRTLQDIYETEFRVDSPDNFRASVEKGHLRVNRKVAPLDLVLKNGDLIEHTIHRHENPVTGTPIEIIEDNDDVVVINKPASIPCHPCGKYRFNTIVFILGKEFGYANLRNIYRLDRLTSGVLILGKTARKTKELENQVLRRNVYKEYVARVAGEFPEGEVEVDQPLSPLSHKLTLWHVETGGKPSRTTFQRLSYNGTTSVVRCIPHTGRTHQIRVHLQYLGHPIVNDPYYNSPAWGPLRGKGGVCETSFEELCKRIMAEHNVGMWVEGENPLFSQQMASKDNPLQSSVKHTDSTPTTEAETTLSEGTTTEDGPTAPKQQKLSTDADTSEQTISLDSSGHVVSNSGDSTVSSQSSKKSEVSQEQRGFDPAKWIPDPLCESCRLKYIDPKPQDLVLFLHALRYKGPTWDYSTKLPDWAHEDWIDPAAEQQS